MHTSSRHRTLEVAYFDAGTLSYASQDPWICNATVRDNIVMGADFDSDRYNRVLDACALRPDLAGLASRLSRLFNRYQQTPSFILLYSLMHCLKT